MKKVCVVLIGLCFISVADAAYVRGHYRSNGSYVQGHYRTRADGVKYNNYSTKGNVNPYTGKAGTVSMY